MQITAKINMNIENIKDVMCFPSDVLNSDISFIDDTRNISFTSKVILI